MREPSQAFRVGRRADCEEDGSAVCPGVTPAMIDAT
jgi:hypothetical protein